MDNSRLTNCELNWEGIRNLGGSLNIVNQNNIIENAVIAIEISQGGSLIIDDNNLTVPTVTFLNCSNNAIRGIDADVIQINNAFFENCQQAIILTFPAGNTTAIGNMIVDDCDFVENDEDIKVVSSSGFNNVQISNNNFSGLFGTNISGDSSFDILHNTYSSETFWSTLLYSSGSSNDNTQSNNIISSQIYGLVAMVDNSSYQFHSNCFIENGVGDVIVNGTLDHQGTLNLANANCFTQDQNPDISAFTYGNPFNYWEPDPNGQGDFDDCVYSETSTPDGYTSIQLSFDGFLTDCNSPSFNSNGGASFQSVCDVDDNLAALNSAIATVNNDIANIDQIQFNSPEEKESELAALQRCLVKLTNQLANNYYSDNMFSDAIAVYSSFSSFAMQIKGYFILIDQKQYSLARNYLNSLYPSISEEQEFIQSSLIYLDAVETGSSFVLNDQDESKIYGAAIKSHPLAGYSRSIWMYFKGEDIRMDITLPTGETDPRSIDQTLNKSKSSKIYPNPANTEFHIEVNGLVENIFDYQLLNFEGRLILTGSKLKNIHTVDTSNFPSRVYICKVYDLDGNQVGLHKLQIVR